MRTNYILKNIFSSIDQDCNTILLDLEKMKSLMKGDVFIDLRNVYDPYRVKRAGFQYVGVGRKS